MFLQAGGGGKGIRPIQQQTTQQSQQANQQQTQQHQNHIPQHHHHQQYTQQPLLTPSSSTHSLQAAHHQPSSQTSLHQQQQQQQQSQQQQQQHHGQQQSTTHLSSIQSPLLPHPTQAGQHHHHHHQQHHSAHPHQHHHPPTISYYTPAGPLVISSPTQSSSANASNSATSICSNGSGSTMLRQHSSSGNGAMPTIYAPNAALLQPTATPGFVTPYMQQYPLQTTVIGTTAATALYPNPVANAGNNGTNGGNGGAGQNGAATQQAFYQMTQAAASQQQQQQLFFHAVTTGPTPTTPPHLQPGQLPYRSVPNTAHNPRHGAPTTYIMPTAQTQIFTLPPSQLATSAPQRASLLPAPGQQTVAGPNGGLQMGQLLQAAGAPTGATTYMQAAYCAAPMGMTPAGLAGTSPLLTTPGSLGASTLQTYGHLTNVPLSSSNTSMSSQSEGYTKPRKHAIPIIHPITNENILDPKPLQKSASVEVKPSAPELNDKCSSSASDGCVTANTGSVTGDADSKSSNTSLQDKSITVSLPPCKFVTSSSSATSTGSTVSKDGKTDQQMQTDAVRKKFAGIKIEAKPNEPTETVAVVAAATEPIDDVEQTEALGNADVVETQVFVAATEPQASFNHANKEKEKIVVLEDQRTFPIFQPRSGTCHLETTATNDGGENAACGDVEARTYYSENNERFERASTTHNDNNEKEYIEKQQHQQHHQQQHQHQRQQENQSSMSNEMQGARNIHDKGQQIFIPKRSEQQPAQIQIAKRNFTPTLSQHHPNFMPAFSMKPKTPMTPNEQPQMCDTTLAFSSNPFLAKTTSATTCSTTTLVPTNTVTSTTTSPTKTQNIGQQQQQRRPRGGNNKQNVPSTATSSCSSISSSSGIIHDTGYSSTIVGINATKSSTTLVAGGGNSQQDVETIAAPTTTTFVKPAPTVVWSAKHQQQQQQQSSRNTPTTSDASSSTASTPTHHSSSQHSSTTASTTPTNSKRNQKQKKQKKKKSAEIINRNQNALNVQQSQPQLLLPQKQPSVNSVRGSVSSNYNSNNNSSCSSSSNLNFCSSSSTSNHNSNNKNAINNSGGNNNNNNSGNNQNNNNRNNVKNNNNKKVATTTTFPLHHSNATTTIQTDINNAINYNSSSTNNNNNNNNNYNNHKNNNSNNYNIRKNSLTSSTNLNYKGNQHHQQQHQQQQSQQHQRFVSSNNSDRSSHCSLTFGGIGSDVSSISETDSKASLSAICSDTVVPDLKLNLLSESNTPSSSCLTSPKSNSRHWHTHEIVAQYLTDRSSDKNLGSDDQTIQFLHGSSSTCEDDEENNSRLEFQKDDMSNYENAELLLEHCPQEPLEFSSNKVTLGEIDEVYFGDFCDEKDLIKTTKTDIKNADGTENDEHNYVNITKLNETQRTRQKVEIADTVDCVPIKTLSTSSMTTTTAVGTTAAGGAGGNRKITILKSNEKADPQTKKRNFEAAMRPPAATQPTTKVTTATTTTAQAAAVNIPAEKQFHRYTLTQLKELANNPHSLQAPMVRCQGDCVSQLFVSRQQHHLLTHQTHATLSALAMQQHLQQYQQISYNESLEFVSSNKRRGGGGSGGGSGVDRLKKHHEHMSMMGMLPGAGGSGGGIVAGTIGNSPHQHKKDIIRVHLSLKEEIKLAECENAWMPDTLRGISSSRGPSSLPSNNDLDAVLKKVRGVLNKLTPNNFDALLKELTNVSLNTQEKMQQVMLLIFEKTVSEPNFAPTYAEFCKELFKESKAETKSPFSALLINRIQTEFETNVNDADAKQVKLQPLVDKLAGCQNEKEKLEIKAELEEQEYQFRRRAWGTVRFIGEMYKVQFLTSDRVLLCIESLLEHGSEEKLEFMCKLLTTVGNLLEAATLDKFTIKTRLDNIFRRIQDIVQKTRSGNAQKSQLKISSRVRFMMQDVMDLRARHWDQQQPRTTSTTQATTTTQQSQQQQQQSSLRRKDDKSSSGGGGGGSGSGNIGSSTHDKPNMRGSGGSGGGGFGNTNTGNQVGSHRQQRGGGGGGQNDSHFYNQKGSKHYNNHPPQEQKVNIDVSKLKFTRGDENTPSTTKLGNSSFYLWRTSGRQMATASASSLGTTASTTSAGSSSQQLTTVSSQSSNSSAPAGSSNSTNKLSTRRPSTNPFDVLSNISPATSLPAGVQTSNNSEADETFNSEPTDTDAATSNTCLNSDAAYSTTECKQLVTGLVEEIVEVADDKSAWQTEAINIWRSSNAKQQVSLLHYLLINYLHLGDVRRQQREACAKILLYLMNSADIQFDKAVFTEAYALFGEEVADLLVDVPIGWDYVFEFLGPILHEDLLTFDDIWLSNWLLDTHCTERFLRALINYFSRAHGEEYTGDLWHKRFKLDYGQRFDYDEQRFKTFVKNNHCTYLLKPQVQQTGAGAAATVKTEDVVVDVKKHIECIGDMLRRKNGNDMVMEYIIQKVHINNDFLRGITELICCDIAAGQPDNNSNSGGGAGGGGGNRKERLRGGNKAAAKQRRFEFEIFREKCLPILRLCVDSNEALELSCLDAIFETLLDHYDESTANKMICNIFDLFYDTELIPKETFEKWYRTQSLVDEAIESAGAGAGGNSSSSNSNNNSKSTKNKPSTPKKHAKQSQYVGSGGSGSGMKTTHHTATNNNNNVNATHKISAELHAFMRKLL